MQEHFYTTLGVQLIFQSAQKINRCLSFACPLLMRLPRVRPRRYRLFTSQIPLMIIAAPNASQRV